MLRSFGSFVQCTGALVIWPFICWRDDLTLVHLYNCMNYGHWTTTASYLCPCVHWALDNYLCRPPVAIRSTQTVCYDPDVENWTWNYLFLNQSNIYWHTPPLLDIYHPPHLTSSQHHPTDRSMSTLLGGPCLSPWSWFDKNSAIGSHLDQRPSF